MVDIDQGNLYITTGTLNANPATTITGGTTVQINLTQKIDYILQNPIIFLAIPVSVGNRGNKTPSSRAIDLKMIRETISAQGFLAEDTTERAIDKRNNLIDFKRNKDALTIVWGRGNYQTSWRPKVAPFGGFITKLQFTQSTEAEVLGDIHTTDSSGDVAFVRNSMAVQIQLGRGKDLKS